MSTFLTDAEIAAMLAERKELSIPLSQIASRFKDKRGHKEWDHAIPRPDGSEFQVKVRQSEENALDFSVILALVPAGQTKWFRLRRYNGKSHRHANKVERESAFYDFHIHTATEIYQRHGHDEDGYAQPTDRYGDLNGAIQCLIQDCNIVSSNAQAGLFVQ